MAVSAADAPFAEARDFRTNVSARSNERSGEDWVPALVSLPPVGQTYTTKPALGSGYDRTRAVDGEDSCAFGATEQFLASTAPFL